MNWWKDNLFTMLDIETTSSNPSDAGITSVGLVSFTMTSLNPIKKAYFVMRGYNLESTRSAFNSHTMAWRKINGVDDIERTALTTGTATACETTADLCEYIKNYFTQFNMDEHIIIANHPEFDIAILNRYFHAQNRFSRSAPSELPWRFYNVYDLGSLIRGLGFDKRDLAKEHNIKTTHSALQDAIDQTLLLQRAYSRSKA